MKDITRFGSGILVLSCVYSLSARGGTSFFEDFEAQPVTTPGTKMQSPPIGEPYYYNAGTSVAAVNVVTPPLPVIGTKSLETYRTGSISPDVGGISLDNTLVDGRTLQVQWSHELANGTGHNGNAPMQNSIGYTNGSVGQLAFIIITDVSPHSGEYAYSDAFGGQLPTGLKSTLNGFDRLRMVMTLQSFDQTYMTGTYDLFISLNGEREVQVANDAALYFAQKPVAGDSVVGPLQSMLFRMSKGPFTSNSYYDNISVSDYVAPTGWNVNANGNWSLGTNWSPTTSPNAAAAVASFGSIISAPRTVTLDAPQTVGAINFDSVNAYTIAGSSTLTIDTTIDGEINVASGSHIISAPVVLNKDTIITTAAGTGLAITGSMTATGTTLSKAGAGTVQFENVRGKGLTVVLGTAKISSKGASNSAAGTSVVDLLTIASGAQLDLANNSLVVNYSSVGTLITDLRQHLLLQRLKSTAAAANQALGYADNSILGKSTFSGVNVNPTSALVMFTWKGDANLDGRVNALDFNALATAYGNSNAVWTQADFNYNGVVDTADFNLLASNFNIAPLPAAPALGSLVPEPAGLSLLGLAFASAFPRRRKSAGCGPQG